MIIADILKLKGSKVITITPEESLKTAIDLLEEFNIGALVVLSESGEIAGIISERDLIRYAASPDPDFSTPVRRVMTREVIVGILKDDLSTVAYTMTEKRIRHLPIVDDQGTLIGIISISDIVKAERNHFEGEFETLRTQVLADAD